MIYGILFTIVVFVTVHCFIMKMFKEAAKPVKKSTVPRSKWI